MINDIVVGMVEEQVAQSTARRIAGFTLGYDPGPMERVESNSHHVFIGAECVVKLIDARGHVRLSREIAISTDLPAGLSAPILSHGLLHTDAGDLRYACIARRPGVSPGMGLDSIDRATAMRWADQAVGQLRRLHAWSPGPEARATLEENLEHGGFTTRRNLLAKVARLNELGDVLTRGLVDGLLAIAERAPVAADIAVPVHADCHWGNWLVDNGNVSELLDFEWARLGEPVDDWMFLARFSGPHIQAVLAVIADLTGTAPRSLREGCELREASYLTSDLITAVEADEPAEIDGIIALLRKIIEQRLWWTEE